MYDREDAELLAAHRAEPRPQKAGITYFCTDQHGNVYARYSAGHIVPRYATAAISRKGEGSERVSKACVSYSAHRASGLIFNGWSHEVVPVRAYRGCWTIGREPSRQWALQVEAR